MKTIYKYPVTMGEFDVDMPAGAQVLSVQVQNDQPQMWALVNTAQPVIARRFMVVGTGHSIPHELSSGRFVGTFQSMSGVLIWHLFDLDGV